MTVKRTTQVAVESLSTTDAKVRASQLAVEAISQVSPKLRASQLVAEVLSSNNDLGGVVQPVMFLLVT